MNEKEVVVRRPPRVVFFGRTVAERTRDELCVLLAGERKTYKYIAGKTGLSHSQIALTLRKVGLRMKDVGNCEPGTFGGQCSKVIDRAVRHVMEPMVHNYIHKNVPRPRTGHRAHTRATGENPYPLEEPST